MGTLYEASSPGVRLRIMKALQKPTKDLQAYGD